MLDLVFGANMLGAKSVSVVHCVYDDGFEGVFSFGDFGASLKKFIPVADRSLKHVKRVESGFGGQGMNGRNHPVDIFRPAGNGEQADKEKHNSQRR